VKLGDGHGGFSAEWARERLRVLSSVEPPDSLRDKLMAGIPASAGGQPVNCRHRTWSRGMWWTSVAAVVAITTSVVAWLEFPWERSVRPTVDVNSGSGQVYASDHNSLRPSDSNMYDINGLR